MTLEHFDPLSDAFFEQKKSELKERVSAHRYEHSLGVVDACVMLAGVYGIDERKARLAGILHDWDKCYDDDGIRCRAHELGLKVAAEVLDMAPQALHGMTAALALTREYPEIPEDVIQAISRHTVACVDMQPLDMALYVADAIEVNRDPERLGKQVEELREMVGKETLEKLFFETYRFWTILLLNRTSSLHPDTITVWNEYANRFKPCGKKSFKEMRKELT
ncbi:MAG: bis(5'-nucleosyl)-tetraphosphatase (symmetrical) YqeK [Eggerthellaceae bacterium]|nr:bis(5'-nucleosyl)-tetraphosphatase (symmetrical) YqeK [Eggerthellaceae bacterium]